MSQAERLDPTSTALIVFDMQKGQFEVDDPERRRALQESNILANVVELLRAARAARLPIFYVQNSRRPDFADQKEVITDATIAGGGARGGPVIGTRPWEIMDEIAPEPDDYVVTKFRQGAFSGTTLDTLLRARCIETLILCGVRTTVGIETTCRDGRDLGYNMVLVSDCTGGVPPEEHQWTLQHIFPMLSRVRTGAQVATMLERRPDGGG
jgi:ureidoacrylate peracid hydrolase